MERKRIWELDVFRGICIIGVVIVHAMYDLVNLYKIIQWDYPVWFQLIKNSGFLFLILSGVCVTLGSRSVRRGLIVFFCGMGITLVTYGMYLLKMADVGILIYFGVLHCLGICMMLWPVFKKLPWPALLILGIAFVALGFWFRDFQLETKWLMPLGLVWENFRSSDYFPLFPNLGYFLLGATIGRTVYAKKQTLLPNVDPNRGILKFLQGCGKHSLTIYLVHQPILSAICWLLML